MTDQQQQPAPIHFPATPWRADGICVVRDADGNSLGAVKIAVLGRMATYQQVARLWAASPALSKALRRVIRTLSDFEEAMRGLAEHDDDARADLIERHNAHLRDRVAEAMAALALLDDPRGPARPPGGEGTPCS